MVIDSKPIHGKTNNSVYIKDRAVEYYGASNEYIKVTVDPENRLIEAVPKISLFQGVSKIEFNKDSKELTVIYRDKTIQSYTIPYITEDEYNALETRVQALENKDIIVCDHTLEILF